MTKKVIRKFLPGKLNFFMSLINLPGKNQNLGGICLENIEIWGEFAWKNRHSFTRIHVTQISNQIDATGPFDFFNV